MKHTHNLTYAEACKQYSITLVGPSIPPFNKSDFPPLPLNSISSQNLDKAHRPPVNISCDHTTTNTTLSAHHAGDENCQSGLMLGNLVLFHEFLVLLSLLKRKKNLSICSKSSPTNPEVEWDCLLRPTSLKHLPHKWLSTFYNGID